MSVGKYENVNQRTDKAMAKRKKINVHVLSSKHYTEN
jgi:hypothetical protein